MRIISGILRGKQIRTPGNFKARPTTDLAKESLFNILVHQYFMEDMDILDLFSGTGNISYEFASRGARSVLAIEQDPMNFRFIRETAIKLQLDQLTVLRTDVFRYLLKPIQSFDIIFADPPYDHPGLEKLPDLVFRTEILNKEGVFILEHPEKHSFTAHSHFQQQRRYGGVNFSFFT